MIVKTYKNGNVHVKFEKDELCSALYSGVKTNIDTFIYALNSQVDIHSWYKVSTHIENICDIVFLDTTEKVYYINRQDLITILARGKTLILHGEKPNKLHIMQLNKMHDIDYIDGVFCYPLPF